MIREAIGARALADAGLRGLPTEQGGARPAGVRQEDSIRQHSDGRTMRATRP